MWEEKILERQLEEYEIVQPLLVLHDQIAAIYRVSDREYPVNRLYLTAILRLILIM